MGLDMYIRGVADMAADNFEGLGEEIQERAAVELAYWRKHPDLHGYIVKEFGGGVDECQRIWLKAEQFRRLAAATRARKLPHTSGFFFGESSWTYENDPSDERSAKMIDAVAQWLEASPERKAFYQASW